MKKGKALFLRSLLVSGLLALLLSTNVYSQEFQPTPTQQSIQKSLEQKMPNFQVFWNSKLGIPRQLKGIYSGPLKLDPVVLKTYFFDNFGSLYGIQAPDKEIQAGPIRTDPKGFSRLSLYQKYENIPVYGVSLKLRLDQAKNLESVSGKWIPDIDIDTKPSLDPDQASRRITAYLRQKYTGETPLPEDLTLKPDAITLVIFNPVVYGGSLSANYLAYHVIVKTQVFFVDAHEGEILYTYSNIHYSRDRRTHTSDDCFDLPGTLVLDENGPVGGVVPDTQQQNAHDFAGSVYDYFWNTHGRDSYNQNGSPIVQTVHSGVPLDIISLLICCIFQLDCCGCLEANAAWIPSLDQVVYGDGGTLNDGRSFNPFSDALDVVAHEITHGVTQYSIFDINGDPVGLDYTGESGALNESYSDFFAAMVDRDDWFIGEDLVTAGYPAGAMRNMADPTNGGSYNPADPEGSAKAGHQPDHWDNFVPGGDVHINSGIPNKVAYLIAEGGTHPHSGVVVRGIGRNATEKILYKTLTEELNQTAAFLDARRGTLDSVAALFPGDQFKHVTVWNAFVACGICNSAIAGDCDPKDYPSSRNWLNVHRILFQRKSDLALLRQFRDEILPKTEQGRVLRTSIYRNSREALEVFLNNPAWMFEARKLIEANKDAILEALRGDEGVIYNTNEIISFLDKYAKASPPVLENLIMEIKEDMIKKREQGGAFLGLRLR